LIDIAAYFKLQRVNESSHAAFGADRIKDEEWPLSKKFAEDIVMMLWVVLKEVVKAFSPNGIHCLIIVNLEEFSLVNIHDRDGEIKSFVEFFCIIIYYSVHW
jgi:hypothetical protein